MIKVRFITQVTATGAAALTLPLASGCATSQGEDAANGVAAETAAVSPGEGTLTLHSWDLLYTSKSGGDEFLRVGEKMTAALSFSDALNMLDRGAAVDGAAIEAIQQDPTKLKLTLRPSVVKFDGTRMDMAPMPVTFTAGAGGVLASTSPEFVIPAGAKSLTVDYLAELMKGGVPTSQLLLGPQNVHNVFPVFGAFAPDKLAFFDTMGSTLRMRIVEGGGIVPGSNLTLSVSDWRLDTVADKTNLDLRIGKKENFSRFGTTVVDALGSLEYVVSAVISTDGGKTYQPLTMDRASNPDVLGGTQTWRSAWQKTVAIPANAGPNVDVAFHVQAFLDVPQFGEIIDPKYSPGQRVLLKDTWDNSDGQNYVLPVSASQ